MFKYTPVIVIFVLASCHQKPAEVKWEISAPAGNRYTHIDYKGTTVIPNGRLLTPYGNQVLLAPHPFGLAVSHDGTTAITSNSGTGPFSISIIENMEGNPSVTQIPETGSKESPFKSVFMGLAISPGNAKVYVAGGQDNIVYVFDLKTKKLLNSILCDKSFD